MTEEQERAIDETTALTIAYSHAIEKATPDNTALPIVMAALGSYVSMVLKAYGERGGNSRMWVDFLLLTSDIEKRN